MVVIIRLVNFHVCIVCNQEAFDGNEVFWFETIVLIADSTLCLDNRKTQPDKYFEVFSRRFSVASSFLHKGVIKAHR